MSKRRTLRTEADTGWPCIAQNIVGLRHNVSGNSSGGNDRPGDAVTSTVLVLPFPDPIHAARYPKRVTICPPNAR